MASDGGEQRRGPGLGWRRKVAATRGPKAVLNVDDIVASAIALADEEGLAAVSMRRLAERLGFTTMALYRHVPGKDELIDAMLDAAIGAPPATAADDWRGGLAAWARANFATHRRHRWLLQATIRRAPLGPNHLLWLDAALRALSGLDLDGGQKISVVMLLEHYVRGAAQIAAGIAPESEWLDAYARALRAAVADGRYPALAQVVAAGTFERADAGPDEFEFGLARVLDGVAALVAG